MQIAAYTVVSKWSRSEISVPLERLRLSENHKSARPLYDLAARNAETFSSPAARTSAPFAYPIRT